MKIITFYLPQFHQIPENDKWWGEGFTEWVNVKKAQPLFENHNQPRIPLNRKYYDLSDIDTIRWQVELAKKNHIWGFCFYHYWFGEKLLLQKPMELLLENKDIDFPFCISWANENWTNQWVSNNPKMLIKQEYGDQNEWTRHFNYLLPFFKDKRYIKKDNKPVIVVYKPTNMKCINEMIECWNELAKREGFDGICYCSQISYEAEEKEDYFKNIDFWLDYQPTDTFINITKSKNESVKKIKQFIKKIALSIGIDLEGKKISGLQKYKYEDVWKSIVAKKPTNSRVVPGCFVDWDNTPRKQNKGTVLDGCGPDVFKKYFGKQVKNCIEMYKKEFMFMFAWNEWAEGGYLEPDEKYGDGYLRAIKETLEELDVVPDTLEQSNL